MSEKRRKDDDDDCGPPDAVPTPRPCMGCIEREVALLAMAQAVVSAGAAAAVGALLRRHLLVLGGDNSDMAAVERAMDKLYICHVRAKAQGS